MLIVRRGPQLRPVRAGASTPPTRCGPRRSATLAPHFEHKLFLTATPHNGYPESFTRPAGTARQPAVRPQAPTPDRKQLDAVMVRRLKSRPASPNDLGRLAPVPAAQSWSRSRCRTPTRRRAIHAALRRYTELRTKRAAGPRRAVRHRLRAEDAQEAALLQPGGVPHHAGAAREVAAHGPASEVARPTLSASSSARLDRMDEDYADDDGVRRGHRRCRGHGHPPLRRADRRGAGAAPEDEGLGRNGAVAQRDSKARQLIALAERAHPARREVVERAGHHLHRVPGHPELAPGGPGRRGLHGRRPAADHVRRHGPEEAGGGQGGVPDLARAVSPVRILLATDAASEGIDLQNYCSPADPLRDPLEPEPHGAAERADRPARPEGRRGAGLPLRRQGLQGAGGPPVRRGRSATSRPTWSS